MKKVWAEVFGAKHKTELIEFKPYRIVGITKAVRPNAHEHRFPKKLVPKSHT